MQLTFNNTLKFCFVAILSALIWLQPFFGGGRIPAFILILIGAGLLMRKQFPLSDQRWHHFSLIIALLWLPAFFSSLGSSYASDSVLFLSVLPLFSLMAIASFYTFDKYLSLDLLSKIIVVVCSIWMVDALIQYVLGHDLLGHPLLDGERLVGPFGHLRLGLFLSVLLPVALQYLERYGYKWQITYFFFVFFIVMATGVRTDLFTVLLATSLYTLTHKKARLLLLLVPVVVGAGLIVSSQSEITKTKMAQTLDGLPTTYEQWDHLLTHRLDIWSAGWAMLKANPVRGVGIQGFEKAYFDYSTEDNFFHDKSNRAFHAHNPIVSVAAETGLLGLGGLLGIASLLIYLGSRTLGYALMFKNAWAQVLVLIFFPIQSMPILFKLWWFPFVLLVIMCYLQSLHLAEKNKA